LGLRQAGQEDNDSIGNLQKFTFQSLQRGGLNAHLFFFLYIRAVHLVVLA
jgi:hypothetical protein